MYIHLKNYIYQDLIQVQNNLIKELENDLDQQVAKELIYHNPHIFDHLGPMLVLAYAKRSPSHEKAQNLVTAVYLLLLAHHIHQNRNENNNLNLLLGDYCFSKFYNYLCQHNLLEWLTDFSQLICQLQEAAVIKAQNNLEALDQALMEEIVDKDYANLCSLCCYIGGSLNNSKYLSEHRKFGLNIGRCFYLSQLGLAPGLAQLFLTMAARDLIFMDDFEFQAMIFKLLNHLDSKVRRSLNS